MYQMFVDKDVIATIHDVADRLAASAATPSEWASTELGKLVRFTNDRSQDGVRKTLLVCTDVSLQENGVFMRIRNARSSFFATHMPKGKRLKFLPRAMGLSSFCSLETLDANNDTRRQCEDRVSDPSSCCCCPQCVASRVSRSTTTATLTASTRIPSSRCRYHVNRVALAPPVGPAFATHLNSSFH